MTGSGIVGRKYSSTEIMTEKIIEHYDMFGHLLALDDVVIYPATYELRLGKIVKLNHKMIKLARLQGSDWRKQILVYPNNCLLANEQDVTMFLLKKAK